jgi:hypothetical protein
MTSQLHGIQRFCAEYQLCRLHLPTSSDLGSITAVTYLPVKLEKQGRISDLWHCVVIGYSSGKHEHVEQGDQDLGYY